MFAQEINLFKKEIKKQREAVREIQRENRKLERDFKEVEGRLEVAKATEKERNRTIRLLLAEIGNKGSDSALDDCEAEYTEN